MQENQRILSMPQDIDNLCHHLESEKNVIMNFVLSRKNFIIFIIKSVERRLVVDISLSEKSP